MTILMSRLQPLGEVVKSVLAVKLRRWDGETTGLGG